MLEKDIDAADINHRLFDSKTRSELNAVAAAAESLVTFRNGRISVVALGPEKLSALDIERENYDAFIETARSLAGSDVAVSVRPEPGETGCRVSMRSTGDVDVSRVCAAFGGGGHIRAAGCTVETPDVGEAVRLIVAETEKQMI